MRHMEKNNYGKGQGYRINQHESYSMPEQVLISLYLSGEDFALIRQILQDRGEDSSDEKCIELARKAAKSGIYQLVIAKKSESNQSLEAEMRGLVDKLFAMVRMNQNNL